MSTKDMLEQFKTRTDGMRKGLHLYLNTLTGEYPTSHILASPIQVPGMKEANTIQSAFKVGSDTPWTLPDVELAIMEGVQGALMRYCIKLQWDTPPSDAGTDVADGVVFSYEYEPDQITCMGAIDYLMQAEIGPKGTTLRQAITCTIEYDKQDVARSILLAAKEIVRLEWKA